MVNFPNLKNTKWANRLMSSKTVNLSSYADRILDSEDRPLFDDAVAAGKAGALRAAYIMIWLTCAESFKRRFREAQKRDRTVEKIIFEIKGIERRQKSVDKFLLKKARDYGFISDSAYTTLDYIYKMRCLYGHPYEKAPSREEVSHAADTVVECVLSKPVKLSYRFAEGLLKDLLEEQNYLDNQEIAVKIFTKGILSRLDKKIYGWLLDKYWEELEKNYKDRSLDLFFRRGVWFSRTMLTEVSIDVFSQRDWHNKFTKFANVLVHVCSPTDIFKKIGKEAQDSLIGEILTWSSTRAGRLKYLEMLNNDGALNKRQRDRFFDHVSGMETEDLLSSKLSTKICYTALIDSIKRPNWYVQNPAIDLVILNGAEQATELNENQQINLGRNLLQAAQGSAGSACTFLANLSKDGTSWPMNVVRGIALESFTNEKNEIRFKVWHLDLVLSALNHLKQKQQKQIIKEIVVSINEGTPKHEWALNSTDDIIKKLEAYKWTQPLIKSLKAKVASLPIKNKDT